MFVEIWHAPGLSRITRLKHAKQERALLSRALPRRQADVIYGLVRQPPTLKRHVYHRPHCQALELSVLLEKIVIAGMAIAKSSSYEGLHEGVYSAAAYQPESF